MAHFLDPWRNGGTGTGAYILKANTATQIPLSVQAAASQTANVFVVENSAGSDLFSVDISGNVTLAGSISAVINETVTGSLTLTGALTVNGASNLNGNVTLGDINTDTLTINAISTFKSMITMNEDLVGNIIQLQEQAVTPANGANIGKLYTKEVSGITELFYLDSSSNETRITAAGAETVAGPASSTDNAAARFDGTTGRLLQNSIVIIGDNVAGSNIIDVAAPIVTTANIIDVGDADSLSTGSILNLVSNSSDTGTRTLFQLTNDNTLATGTTVVQFKQDSTGIGLSCLGPVTITPAVVGSTTQNSALLLTGAAHTALTASTEAFDVSLALARTVQFATGALTLQRAVNITAPTYGFVLASTLSDAVTFSVSGAPVAGTNATITRRWTATFGTLEATSLTPTVGVGVFNAGRSDLIVRDTTNNHEVILSAGTDRGWVGTTSSSSFDIVVGNITKAQFGTQLWQITMGAQASGASRHLLFTSPADTGMTASTEVINVDWNTSATRQWATGALATQREFLIQGPTYGFVGASTLTTAVTFAVDAAPEAGTNATLTNSYVASFGGTVNLGATSSGQTYAGLDIPAHTVTVTGTTQVTSVGYSGIRIGTITLTDASAVTIDNSAALYIAAAPVSAGSVTLTNPYSIWVDAGVSRFDGRVLKNQGADVASTNNLVLGTDGNVFEITGTTQINLIANTGWTNGSVITLVFNESLTVADAQATSGANITIMLSGSANFSATAEDTLTLVLSENTVSGQAWREVARSAN